MCHNVILSRVLFTLIPGVFLLVHHLCCIHHASLLHEGCHHSQRDHRVLSYCCPQCLPLLYSRPCGAPGMAGQCSPVCLAMCVPRAVSFTLCANCLSLPCRLKLLPIACDCACVCGNNSECLLSQRCILLFINWVLIVILINYF